MRGGVKTPTTRKTPRRMMMKKWEFLKYKCLDRNTSLFPSPNF